MNAALLVAQSPTSEDSSWRAADTRTRPYQIAEALSPDHKINPHYAVRRERRGFSVGEIPTRQLSLQPVATGAVVEATKRSKPPVERVVKRLGEHAGRNVSER